MSTNQLTINLSSNWLPNGWVKVSQEGNENMVTYKLCHIDPESQANQLLVSGNPTAVVNGETVSVHGITPRGTMTKFFDAMTTLAATGWMEGYTPQKITEIRGDFNKMQDEKYDSTYYISVCLYPDETQAQQALQNQLDLHTKGLDYGKLFQNLQNPEVQKFLTSEQKKNMELLTQQTKNIKLPTPPSDLGIKYFMDKYADYPAVFSEMDNPEYQRFIAPKPKVKPRDPNKFQGGGFDPLAGKNILLKPPKPTTPPKTIKGFLALKIGKYIISGTLLSAIYFLPKGETFHESLTKTNTYIEKEQVEDKMYITKHLIPITSSYTTEGYATQEQVEKIITSIIDSLN
ncbi:MAG: hypothetical protein WC895_02830 [Candidatus Shapirobacteria bacterium]